MLKFVDHAHDRNRNCDHDRVRDHDRNRDRDGYNASGLKYERFDEFSWQQPEFQNYVISNEN